MLEFQTINFFLLTTLMLLTNFRAYDLLCLHYKT